MSSFVDLSSLGLAVTSSDLLQEWLTFMQTKYPGYQPSPTALEYIHAQGLSALWADVSQAGVVVPNAAFRALGVKLHGVPYQQGLPATATAQVTAVDTTGYTLPAGTNLFVGAYGFATLADLTIAPGATSGTVTASATTVGSAANGATNPTSFVSIVDWVSTVTVLGPASGGVDPESDTDYQNRLTAQLRLSAPRPITAIDYATMALSYPPTPGTDDELIGRATALDGYSDANAAFTVTADSTNVLTVTAAPGTGITAAQGAPIAGTDIQSGSIVTASTSSTITMSKAASGSGTGITATVGGTLGNERTVTVAVTDASGDALDSDTKTALAAWLGSYREINFDVAVIDPTYTPVYATCSLVLYPGFDPTASATAVQAAIMAFLSPPTFGLPTFGDTSQWLAGTVIYYNQLIGVIQNAAQGAVQAVVDGSLKLGLSATPTGTVDLVIPGPLGLPTSTTTTVPLPTVV